MSIKELNAMNRIKIFGEICVILQTDEGLNLMKNNQMFKNIIEYKLKTIPHQIRGINIYVGHYCGKTCNDTLQHISNLTNKLHPKIQLSNQP